MRGVYLDSLRQILVAPFLLNYFLSLLLFPSVIVIFFLLLFLAHNEHLNPIFLAIVVKCFFNVGTQLNK